MSDGDDIRTILSAVGRLEGSQVAQTESLKRIEKRMDAGDEAHALEIKEIHERITQHRINMEARLDMRARQADEHILDQTTELREQADGLRKTVDEHTSLIASATASWRTLVGMGGAVCGLAALIVAILEITSRVHS